MNPLSETPTPRQRSTTAPQQPLSTSDLLLSLDLSKTLHLPVEPRPNCCDICGRYFSRYDNLERHRRTHLNQKLFDCEDCGKSFSQKSHLKEHSTVHTGDHPYKCNVCGYAFSRKGNLSRHMKTHEEQPTLSTSSVITTATLLRKVTSSISESSNNVLGPTLDVQEPEEVDALAEEPDSLGVDSSSKSIISAFSRHHRRQHGDNTLDINSDNPFGCKACWKAFSQGSYNSRNKVHQRIHSALKPYKCDLCPKSFSQRSHLKVHRRIHTGEKPFSCPTCAFTFSRNDHLERHMRTHHGQKTYRVLGSSNRGNTGGSGNQCGPRTDDTPNANNDKEMQPSTCGCVESNCSCCCNNSCNHNTKESKCNSESSNIRADLGNHSSNSNNNNNPQKATTQNGHLDSSSEDNCESSKPLDCSLCFKAFSKRSHESMHKQIHQAVLPYKCNVCGKAFPQNGNLTRHKRTHVGEKRFKCDVCGKAFSQRSHVKVHQLIHIGNRPYKCNDCGYAFRRPDHLLRHKQTNAGNTRLSCVSRQAEETQNSDSEVKRHREKCNMQTEPQLRTSEQADSREVEGPLQNPLNLVQPVPLNLHSPPVDIPYYNTDSVAATLVNIQPNQASVANSTSLPLGVSHYHTRLPPNFTLSHHSLPQTSALPPHLNIALQPRLTHTNAGFKI